MGCWTVSRNFQSCKLPDGLEWSQTRICYLLTSTLLENSITTLPVTYLNVTYALLVKEEPAIVAVD